MLRLTCYPNRPITILLPEKDHPDKRTHTICQVNVDGRDSNAHLGFTFPEGVVILRPELWEDSYYEFPEAVFAHNGVRVKDIPDDADIFQLPALN